MDRRYGDVDYMTGCRQLEVDGLIELIWSEENGEWGFEVTPPGVELVEGCGWPANDLAAQVLVLAAFSVHKGLYESLEDAMQSETFKASEVFSSALDVGRTE